MNDDELDEALSALPHLRPSADFADRVMARVAVPALAAAPPVTSRWRRRRWPVALAASVALVVMGATAASVVVAMGQRALLAALGERLLSLAGTWALQGAQTVTATVLASPAAGILQSLARPSASLIAAFVLGSLVYMSGWLALRRLLHTPPGAMHARS